MIDDVKSEAEDRMGKSIEALNANFQKVRTGRAHTGILDQVTVDYYGAMVPISQAASVTLIDSRTIGVKPFDPKTRGAIEKAIRDANLGLNPAATGDVIRVPMPSLTEERRKDLIRIVKGDAEEARVSVRAARRDANNAIKSLLKDKTISEDESHRAEEAVQKLTDKFIKKIDELLEVKEKDLMQV